MSSNFRRVSNYHKLRKFPVKNIILKEDANTQEQSNVKFTDAGDAFQNGDYYADELNFYDCYSSLNKKQIEEYKLNGEHTTQNNSVQQAKLTSQSEKQNQNTKTSKQNESKPSKQQTQQQLDELQERVFSHLSQDAQELSLFTFHGNDKRSRNNIKEIEKHINRLEKDPEINGNELCDHYTDLALQFYGQGQIKKSIEVFDRIKQLFEKSRTFTADFETFDTAKGFILNLIGDYEQTIRIVQNAIDSQLDRFEIGSYSLAIKYEVIGKAHELDFNFNKALYFYERSLIIKESASLEYGIQSQNLLIANALDNISKVYEKKAQYECMQEYLEKSAELRGKYLNSNENNGIAGSISLEKQIIQIKQFLAEAKLFYFCKNQLDKALERLDKILNLNDKRPLLYRQELEALMVECVHLRAKVYIAIGSYDKAHQCLVKLNELISRSEQELQIYNYEIKRLQGNISFKKEEHSKALIDFNIALEVIEKTKKYNHTDLGNLYNDIGFCYSAIEVYDKAIESYEKSQKIKQEQENQSEKEKIQVNLKLANLYQQKKMFHQSKEQYGLLLKTKQFQDNRDDYKEMVEIYHNYTLVAAQSGDFDLAITKQEEIKKIIELQFGQDSFHYLQNQIGFGKIYAFKKDYKQSLLYYTQAIEFCKKNIGTLTSQSQYISIEMEAADAHRELQQYNSALLHLESALTVAANSSRDLRNSIQYKIAECHHSQKEYQKAIECLQKILSESLQLRKGSNSNLRQPLSEFQIRVYNKIIDIKMELNKFLEAISDLQILADEYDALNKSKSKMNSNNGLHMKQNIEVFDKLGHCYYENRNLQSALENFAYADKILQKLSDPKSYEGAGKHYFMYGRGLKENGDDGYKEVLLKAQTFLDPNAPENEKIMELIQ